jgi:hypothetical protein
MVASNSDDLVHEATRDGFAHYAAHPDEIENVIKKLTAPLKGVGPATASLLLAVHDPQNIVFFSDEVYAWLVNGGNTSSPAYSIKEFQQIFTAANALAKRLDVTPIDIEKVAYVIIRENEPVYEPKPKKAPSGLGPGRPRMAEHEKKPKKAPSGLGRGRPKLAESEKKPKPEKSNGVRGRPKKAATGAKNPASKAAAGTPRGRPRKSEAETVAEPTPKSRGRPGPSVNKPGVAPPTMSGKSRGRPKKEAAVTVTKSTKRKADDGEKPAGRGRPKKVKA